jgi:hypothetical protein
MTWKGQKVKEELTALRIGYLGQELRHRQRSVFQGVVHKVTEVQPCLDEIDRGLALLSSRMNGYQRAQVVEIWDRVAARHEGASCHLAQLWVDAIAQDGEDAVEARRLLAAWVSGGDEMKAWMTWQDEDWREVHSLLEGIVAFDGKCGPWFEIGDHLGDTVFRLLDNRLAVPLTPQKWDYLYSGVDKLPPRVQRCLGVHFPSRYKNAHHLVCQLEGTFGGICNLLEGEKYGLDTVPKWDGINLVYRNRRALIRVTRNSVIVPVLNELERQAWPWKPVALPPGFKGDVKQAIHNFNKQYQVVRLSWVGDKVCWRP